MPFQVVDADKGLAQGHGQPLGEVEAHHQRPHQPGAIGNRHRIHLGEVHPRLLQRPLEGGHQGQDVLTGSDFRDDAPIAGVEFHLGGDNMGQEGASIGHQADARFITGGLYPKHQHGYGGDSVSGGESLPLSC
ncbi:hypothetical protein HRbin23_01653 [bacterium HR23]|nr:hypothetical protein HRbin23_01653 [bacterium HR23]